jgi:Ser/Thr protein kinase RdoA (MazF antagonist)
MTNTLLDASTLLPVLTAEYNLPAPVECVFLRRGFNDHYEVRAAQGRYILRVYFQGKYYIESDSDFRFELDLLDFLYSNGVPVSHAVRRNIGDLLGTLQTSGGVRHFALFTYAEGETAKTLDPTLARTLGQTVARLHSTADRFQTMHRRYHLNLEYLLDKPMQLIEAFLQEQGQEGVKAYHPAIEALRTKIQALPTTAPMYGIIHGDLHGGNRAVTEEGIFTFFDFDHGGYGWRAYDLAICQCLMSEEAWNACLEGYQQIRPLLQSEIESIPIFRKLSPIWDKGDILAMRTAWGDREEFGEEFVKQIQTTFATLFGSDSC